MNTRMTDPYIVIYLIGVGSLYLVTANKYMNGRACVIICIHDGELASKTVMKKDMEETSKNLASRPRTVMSYSQ